MWTSVSPVARVQRRAHGVLARRAVEPRRHVAPAVRRGGALRGTRGPRGPVRGMGVDGRRRRGPRGLQCRVPGLHAPGVLESRPGVRGRGLRSFTFQLNLSRF